MRVKLQAKGGEYLAGLRGDPTRDLFLASILLNLIFIERFAVDVDGSDNTVVGGHPRRAGRSKTRSHL